MNISQVWRWPMHSPRRLFGTLAFLIVVIAGLTALTTVTSGRPTAAPATATSSPAGGPPAASPTDTETETAEPSPTGSKDYGQALDVARQFVTAWASHPGDFQVWYASVAVHATDDYARRLATVDPDNVPATKVSGALRLTDTGGMNRTEVAVPTDKGLVSVTMLQDRDGSWRVSDLQPGAQTEAG